MRERSGSERFEGGANGRPPPTALTTPSIPTPCYNRSMPFNRTQALTEIEQRNRLRKSASLPLLDIEAELARLEQVDRATAFEAFLESNRKLYSRTLRKATSRRGRAYGNLNWRPHSFQGWEFENHVRRLFWRRFLGAGST